MDADGTNGSPRGGAKQRACGVADAAKYLGISVASVYGLIRNDVLPARRFGGRYLIEYSDLDSVFDSLPEAD